MTNDHIQHKPVGYRSPPKKHTFKDGHKGMGGRPPKNKSNPAPTTTSAELDRLIIEEADRVVTVKENGKVTKKTIYQAALRSLSNAAMKHPASRRDFIRLTQEARQREADARWALVQEAQDYKTFWKPIFADCARRGVSPPDILPHPDDVQILDGDRVVFNGPIDEQDKAWWDYRVAENARRKHDRSVTFPNIIEFWRRLGRLDDRQEDPTLMEDDEDDSFADVLIQIVDIKYPTEGERRVPGFDLAKHREKAKALIPAKLRKEILARRRKRPKGWNRGAPPPLGETLAELFVKLPEAKAAGLTAEMLSVPFDQTGEVRDAAGVDQDNPGA